MGVPWYRWSEGKTTAAIEASERFALMEAQLQALIDGGGGGLLHQQTTILDNDQIVAIPTTPPLVVTAAGANTIIYPLYPMITANFAGGAYTAEFTSFAWQLRYVGLTATKLSTFFAIHTQLTAANVTFNPAISRIAAGAGDYASEFHPTQAMQTAIIVNTGVELFDFNTESPYSGGHEDNTLMVTVPFFVRNLLTGLLV